MVPTRGNSVKQFRLTELEPESSRKKKIITPVCDIPSETVARMEQNILPSLASPERQIQGTTLALSKPCKQISESTVLAWRQEEATRRSGGSRTSASTVAGILDELVTLTGNWKKLYEQGHKRHIQVDVCATAAHQSVLPDHSMPSPAS